MKAFLISLLFVLAVATTQSASNRLTPPKAAALPTACNIGDMATKTAATAGLYVCTAANTWSIVSSGTVTGAPADATYITQTASTGLSAEQALSTLASGIMRVATTTGAITALTDSAGIAANISNETGTGVMVFGTAPTLTGFTTAGTAPAVANVGADSCGTTAATIAGNNHAGAVTVGATLGTQCRLTFTVAAANRWHCTVTNETTAALARATYVDTTHVDLLGAFTAGDVVTYLCLSR